MAAAGEEGIPDGSGSREAMFSARFDGKETERLFRQVYSILKERNYPVMMEEGAGGDFGTTAIFLGRLRKHKGVMLSVCTSHYGEITNSTYSSYNEVKFAQDHNVEILPLRMCEDPWPPEPPSGPHHPYDKDGTAEGLLAMAIPPSKIFVDCRGRDAKWIAAQIALTLRQKGFNPGPSPSTERYSQQDAKAVVRPSASPSPADVKEAEDKDIRQMHWYSHYRHTLFQLLQTLIDDGATGVVVVGIMPTLENKMTCEEFPVLQQDLQTAYLQKKAPFYWNGDLQFKFEDITFKRVQLDDLCDELRISTRRNKAAIIASCCADHAETATNAMREHNKSRPDGHGKVSRGWATAQDVYGDRGSHSASKAASPKDAEAAGFLPSPRTAASTGPEAKGADPGASSSTPQGPIAAALRKGMAGGSKDLAASVADAAATAEPKAQGPGEEAKALAPSASPSPADAKEAKAFWDLGRKGGGERNGQSYSKKACFVKAVELDEMYALAWRNLGLVGGGTVKGQAYDAKDRACFVKAVEVDENYAIAWNSLGNQDGGTVKGQAYDAKDCFVRALELNENPSHEPMFWRNLGDVGGGTVCGTHYSPDECEAKAKGK
ncbi:unnamed protein product [Symbiodinium sp. CCMP2592]|nr:unnamed protein product [Symbiodinium sp. CCMP2592]